MVLLNITLVTFLILGNPNRHHPKHKMDGREHFHEVQRILELEEGQKKEFKKIADEHLDGMLALEKLQKESVREFFKKNLAIEVEQNQVILREIEQLEREKVLLTLQHFKEVKEILNERQNENFNDFTEWVMDKLLKTPGKHLKPPKGGQKHKPE